MIAARQRLDNQIEVLPCRVVVAAPPAGFGRQLATMRAWLDHHCAGRWDAAPAGLGGVVNDALAFYFADADAARAFVGRFSCGYRVVY